ncbi:hypothetical protein GUJ93_ZPchr0007g5866 [Zizania palustris]|uniref:non-specific serine/threonine protein kinase n=1 Tax=Zizania palustris TaxID=103762 RepID=A0A8J5TDV7_ZIZPA|nr:hypothetical protein GUJ93_ZPchr0007g5866 [Zizania palustris]
MGSSDLSSEMERAVLGLTLWVWIAIGVVALLVAILLMVCIWVASRRKMKRTMDSLRQTQIPIFSKEIPVDRVGSRSLAQTMHEHEQSSFPPQDKHTNQEPEKTLGHMALRKSSDPDNMSQGSSVCNADRGGSVHSGEDGSTGHGRKPYSPAAFVSASPLVGLPEFSHLGWGHWFTLRDIELATNRFSRENVLGEGGYGVVYRGRLVNGTEVAIKKIFNNMGQAEKEFRVEVEAIGHVRHKNLVRLLGYCVEGVNRMLVYEFVNNGNLEQWLHGAMCQCGIFSWENRMKVVIGTAKALAYLHEAIEPKVVHRDIKSSNILIDDEFNGKVSDFGLAKLLGSDKSHITTRVMGTFGYVAPEYANTGMLNEKSDVYSFGVLLLETVTGREPVDYSRSVNEVNLVEWLKIMVTNRRAEEVVDPILEVRPSVRAIKRALLVALRCVDPDSEKRPKMGQIVRMLESEEVPYREDWRNRRSRTGSMDIESIAEGSNSTEFANKVERTGSSTSDRSQS